MPGPFAPTIPGISQHALDQAAKYYGVQAPAGAPAIANPQAPAITDPALQSQLGAAGISTVPQPASPVAPGQLPAYDPATMGPIQAAIPQAPGQVVVPQVDITPGPVGKHSPEAIAKAKSYFGGGGGGGSPFGKLEGDVKRTREELYGNMEQEKRDVQHISDLEAAKNKGVAAGQASLAARQAVDESNEWQRQAAEKDTADRFMADTESLANEVRNAKVDGSRVMRDGWTQALTIIGGALGGFYQGLTGGKENEFMKHVDGIIERDIRVQESAIANKKSVLQARQSMFGQMMQQHGDARLARAQLRTLSYEAMRTNLASQAAEMEIPVAQANADRAITLLDRNIDASRKMEADEALRVAKQQAAAAAAARAAAEEKAFQRGVKLEELRLKGAEVDSRNRKETGDDAKSLAKELADEKIAGARKLVEGMEVRIARRDEKGNVLYDPATGRPQLDETRGLPGVGRGGDLKEWLGSPLVGKGSSILLSDEEKVSRQEWRRMGLEFRHAVTGAGGSDAEAAKIESAFGDANSPAEQANALRIARQTIDDLEARRKAGYRDEVVETVEGRINRRGGARLPPSARTGR